MSALPNICRHVCSGMELTHCFVIFATNTTLDKHNECEAIARAVMVAEGLEGIRRVS